MHKPTQSQLPSSVKVKPEPLIENKGTLRKTIKVANIAAEVVKKKGEGSSVTATYYLADSLSLRLLMSRVITLAYDTSHYSAYILTVITILQK